MYWEREGGLWGMRLGFGMMVQLGDGDTRIHCFMLFSQHVHIIAA
jgi:hypothetical protein